MWVLRVIAILAALHFTAVHAMTCTGRLFALDTASDDSLFGDNGTLGLACTVRRILDVSGSTPGSYTLVNEFSEANGNLVIFGTELTNGVVNFTYSFVADNAVDLSGAWATFVVWSGAGLGTIKEGNCTLVDTDTSGLGFCNEQCGLLSTCNRATMQCDLGASGQYSATDQVHVVINNGDPSDALSIYKIMLQDANQASYTTYTTISNMLFPGCSGPMAQLSAPALLMAPEGSGWCEAAFNVPTIESASFANLTFFEIDTDGYPQTPSPLPGTTNAILLGVRDEEAGPGPFNDADTVIVTYSIDVIQGTSSQTMSIAAGSQDASSPSGLFGCTTPTGRVQLWTMGGGPSSFTLTCHNEGGNPPAGISGDYYHTLLVVENSNNPIDAGFQIRVTSINVTVVGSHSSLILPCQFPNSCMPPDVVLVTEFEVLTPTSGVQQLAGVPEDDLYAVYEYGCAAGGRINDKNADTGATTFVIPLTVDSEVLGAGSASPSTNGAQLQFVLDTGSHAPSTTGVDNVAVRVIPESGGCAGVLAASCDTLSAGLCQVGGGAQDAMFIGCTLEAPVCYICYFTGLNVDEVFLANKTLVIEAPVQGNYSLVGISIEPADSVGTLVIPPENLCNGTERALTEAAVSLTDQSCSESQSFSQSQSASMSASESMSTSQSPCSADVPYFQQPPTSAESMLVAVGSANPGCVAGGYIYNTGTSPDLYQVIHTVEADQLFMGFNLTDMTWLSFQLETYNANATSNTPAIVNATVVLPGGCPTTAIELECNDFGGPGLSDCVDDADCLDGPAAQCEVHAKSCLVDMTVQNALVAGTQFVFTISGTGGQFDHPRWLGIQSVVYFEGMGNFNYTDMATVMGCGTTVLDVVGLNSALSCSQSQSASASASASPEPCFAITTWRAPNTFPEPLFAYPNSACTDHQGFITTALAETEIEVVHVIPEMGRPFNRTAPLDTPGPDRGFGFTAYLATANSAVMGMSVAPSLDFYIMSGGCEGVQHNGTCYVTSNVSDVACSDLGEPTTNSATTFYYGYYCYTDETFSTAEIMMVLNQGSELSITAAKAPGSEADSRLAFVGVLLTGQVSIINYPNPNQALTAVQTGNYPYRYTIDDDECPVEVPRDVVFNTESCSNSPSASMSQSYSQSMSTSYSPEFGEVRIDGLSALKRSSIVESNCDDALLGCPLVWELQPLLGEFAPFLGFSVNFSQAVAAGLPFWADQFVRGVEFDAWHIISDTRMRHRIMGAELTTGGEIPHGMRDDLVCDHYETTQGFSVVQNTSLFDIETLCPDAFAKSQISGFSAPYLIEHFQVADVNMIVGGTYDTISVFWQSVYPGESIYIGNVKVLTSNFGIGDSFFRVDVLPAGLNVTAAACDTETRAALPCTCDKGCVGDDAGMSYYMTPVFAYNRSAPSLSRRVEYHSTPHVNETFDVFFQSDQRLYPLWDEMMSQNGVHTAAQGIVSSESCNVLVYAKECSGALQVWVRPNMTVSPTGAETNGTSIGSIMCYVNSYVATDNDFTVIPLTTGVYTNLPFSSPNTPVRLEIRIGESADGIANITVAGAFGFEITRVLQGPVEGITVECDLAGGHGVVQSGNGATPDVYVPAFPADDWYCQGGDESMTANTVKPGLNVSKMQLDVFEHALFPTNDIPSGQLPRVLTAMGTPQCPGGTMCPADGWFIDQDYALVPRYDGLAMAFPDDAFPGPALTDVQTAVMTFRFSSPQFQSVYADFVTGPGDTWIGSSLLVTVYTDYENLEGSHINALIEVGTNEGTCGVQNCTVTPLMEVDAALIVHGVGLPQFSGVGSNAKLSFSFDLQNCMAYSAGIGVAVADMIMTIRLNFTGVSDVNTVANRLYVAGVGFGMSSQKDTIPFLVYRPDRDCTRTAFVYSLVCDSVCPPTYYDVGVLTPNATVSGYARDHPNSTFYEELYATGSPWPPLLHSSLLEWIAGEEAFLPSPPGYVAALNAFRLGNGLVYHEGFSSHITFAPANVRASQTFIFQTFDPSTVAQMLMDVSHTVAAPFQPGIVAEHTGSQVRIYGVSVGFQFFVNDTNQIDKPNTAAGSPVFPTICFHDTVYQMSTEDMFNNDGDIVSTDTAVGGNSLPEGAAVFCVHIGFAARPTVLDPIGDTSEVCGGPVDGGNPFGPIFCTSFNWTTNTLIGHPGETFRLGDDVDESGLLGALPGFFAGAGSGDASNIRSIFEFLATFAGSPMSVASANVRYRFGWFPCLSDCPNMGTHTVEEHPDYSASRFLTDMPQLNFTLGDASSIFPDGLPGDSSADYLSTPTTLMFKPDGTLRGGMSTGVDAFSYTAGAIPSSLLHIFFDSTNAASMLSSAGISPTGLEDSIGAPLGLYLDASHVPGELRIFGMTVGLLLQQNTTRMQFVPQDLLVVVFGFNGMSAATQVRFPMVRRVIGDDDLVSSNLTATASVGRMFTMTFADYKGSMSSPLVGSLLQATDLFSPPARYFDFDEGLFTDNPMYGNASFQLGNNQYMAMGTDQLTVSGWSNAFILLDLLPVLSPSVYYGGMQFVLGECQTTPFPEPATESFTPSASPLSTQSPSPSQSVSIQDCLCPKCDLYLDAEGLPAGTVYQEDTQSTPYLAVPIDHLDVFKARFEIGNKRDAEMPLPYSDINATIMTVVFGAYTQNTSSGAITRVFNASEVVDTLPSIRGVMTLDKCGYNACLTLGNGTLAVVADTEIDNINALNQIFAGGNNSIVAAPTNLSLSMPDATVPLYAFYLQFVDSVPLDPELNCLAQAKTARGNGETVGMQVQFNLPHALLPQSDDEATTLTVHSVGYYDGTVDSNYFLKELGALVLTPQNDCDPVYPPPCDEPLCTAGVSCFNSISPSVNSIVQGNLGVNCSASFEKYLVDALNASAFPAEITVPGLDTIATGSVEDVVRQFRLQERDHRCSSGTNGVHNPYFDIDDMIGTGISYASRASYNIDVPAGIQGTFLDATFMSFSREAMYEAAFQQFPITGTFAPNLASVFGGSGFEQGNLGAYSISGTFNTTQVEVIMPLVYFLDSNSTGTGTTLALNNTCGVIFCSMLISIGTDSLEVENMMVDFFLRERIADHGYNTVKPDTFAFSIGQSVSFLNDMTSLNGDTFLTPGLGSPVYAPGPAFVDPMSDYLLTYAQGTTLYNGETGTFAQHGSFSETPIKTILVDEFSLVEGSTIDTAYERSQLAYRVRYCEADFTQSASSSVSQSPYISQSASQSASASPSFSQSFSQSTSPSYSACAATTPYFQPLITPNMSLAVTNFEIGPGCPFGATIVNYLAFETVYEVIVSVDETGFLLGKDLTGSGGVAFNVSLSSTVFEYPPIDTRIEVTHVSSVCPGSSSVQINCTGTESVAFNNCSAGCSLANCGSREFSCDFGLDSLGLLEAGAKFVIKVYPNFYEPVEPGFYYSPFFNGLVVEGMPIATLNGSCPIIVPEMAVGDASCSESQSESHSQSDSRSRSASQSVSLSRSMSRSHSGSHSGSSSRSQSASSSMSRSESRSESRSSSQSRSASRSSSQSFSESRSRSRSRSRSESRSQSSSQSRSRSRSHSDSQTTSVCFGLCLCLDLLTPLFLFSLLFSLRSFSTFSLRPEQNKSEQLSYMGVFLDPCRTPCRSLCPPAVTRPCSAPEWAPGPQGRHSCCLSLPVLLARPLPRAARPRSRRAHR